MAILIYSSHLALVSITLDHIWPFGVGEVRFFDSSSVAGSRTLPTGRLTELNGVFLFCCSTPQWNHNRGEYKGIPRLFPLFFRDVSSVSSMNTDVHIDQTTGFVSLVPTFPCLIIQTLTTGPKCIPWPESRETSTLRLEVAGRRDTRNSGQRIN